MEKSIGDVLQHSQFQETIPTISSVLQDGTIVETVYDSAQKKTSFVVWKNGTWKVETSMALSPGQRLVPYSANNNLIKNGVILFPQEPAEYGSEEDLLCEIQAFIHRYVDVSPLFEKVATYYVLLSWVYDGFNELPYLRVRGDPGSGKTRFLLTVGSLCYKPIFASGASSVSPLFRMLEIFRGTLIIDEGDFRFSDETAEIVKILNNGNSRGFPVLRSESVKKGEYDPRAYQVFGPKIVATRGYFDDRALESRFITEEMGQAGLRREIPINLPPEHKQEATRLRNKLLLFRFRNFGKHAISEAVVDRAIEPRLNQVFAPLLSIIGDPTAREQIQSVARQYNREMVSDRGMDTEAQILEVIKILLGDPEKNQISIADITSRFAELYGGDYERKITNKWIGWNIRRRLKIKTQKSHGTFVIADTEKPKIDQLFARYGVGDSPSAPPPEMAETPPQVDLGDVGDFTREQTAA